MKYEPCSLHLSNFFFILFASLCEAGPPQQIDCLTQIGNQRKIGVFKDTKAHCLFGNRTRIQQPFDRQPLIYQLSYRRRCEISLSTHIPLFALEKKKVTISPEKFCVKLGFKQNEEYSSVHLLFAFFKGQG